MAMVFTSDVIKRAYTGGKAIKGYADRLKAQVGPISSNTLMAHLEGMRDSYNTDIAPMVAYPAAVVNAEFPVFVKGSVPADPHAAYSAVGPALLALLTAYEGVFQNLPNFVTFTAAGGHIFYQIPLAQLASLSDELDAVIAAVAPLV